MPNDRFDLSRRELLGGLGTIGVVSAGAGLGTTALFSDEETFTNNQLVAGRFDLKVDWEEHYSDWSADEGDGLDVRMADPGGIDYAALPDPDDPLVWVHNDDLEAFMNNTAIEAYPDQGNDGIQDDLATYDACEDFADLPAGLSSDLRTESTGVAGPNPQSTAPGDPLVEITDVKPGDFGELTLSFHLCDNPGYVWLQGRPVAAAEGGNPEPEANDDNEVGAADESYDIRPDDSNDTVDDILNSDIELLDEIRTLLWYDEDGDNVYEPGAGAEETDVMLVFDKSESMNASSGADDNNPDKLRAAVDGGKALVDSLGGNIRVGLTVFADDISQNTGVARGLGSDGTDIKADLEGLIGPNDYDPGSKINDDDGEGDIADDDNLNFETQTGVGIKAAREELLASNPNSKKVMVILSDGNPFNDELNASNQATISKDAGIEIYTIAYGSGANESLMASWASDPTSTHAFVAPDPNEVESVFGQIGQIIGGEECFFRGSLRELLDHLSSRHPNSGQPGIPLDGNRDTPFDELGGDPASDDREEFVDSTNNFIGLAWYLPVDHANEIQTDSVSFDLGFYTEQSRHNDGAGQA